MRIILTLKVNFVKLSYAQLKFLKMTNSMLNKNYKMSYKEENAKFDKDHCQRLMEKLIYLTHNEFDICNQYGETIHT